MADNKEIKKFRGGVRLDPQGTPPTNPEKGTVYIDTDGKQYVYDGTSAWVESIDSKNAQTIGGAKNFSDPITLDHESTPATPASGKVTVYAKDDNKLHILNSDGSEVPIGSGGAGGLDTFFTDDFSTSLVGDFTVSAGSGSLLLESSSPINTKSLKWAAGTTVGQSVLHTAGYTPTLKQKGNTCSIAFWYTYDGSDDDIKVLVKSGSDVLTSSSDLLKSTSTAKKFVTTFTIPSDSTNIQWGFEQVSAASSKVLLIDDVEMSQDPFVQADLGTITEWVNYTPANDVSGFTNTGKWRRVGDTMEIQCQMVYASTIGTGNPNFTIPSGYEIDTDKLEYKTVQMGPSSDITTMHMAPVGTAIMTNDAGASEDATYPGICFLSNLSNKISIFAINKDGNNNLVTSAGTVSQQLMPNPNTHPFTIGAGDSVVIKASVPIKGWGSTNTHIVTPAKSNLTDWTYYEYETSWDSTDSANMDNKDAYWRRVGDEMEIRFSMDFKGTISNTNPLEFKMPKKANGNYYKVDASKLPDNWGNTLPYDTGSVCYRDNANTGTFGDHYFSGCTGIETVSGDTNSDLIRIRMFTTDAGQSGNVGTHVTALRNGSAQANYFGAGSSHVVTDNEHLTATLKVPIEGWGAEDHNFLAALPMTKWQKKQISGGNIISDGFITGLQFSNLDKNKSYKLTAHAFLGASANSTGSKIEIFNGGTAVGDKIQNSLELIIYEGTLNSADAFNELVSLTIIFSPKSDGDGTLKFKAELGSVSDFVGGSGRTFATLEELSMHEETDIW